MNLIRAFFAIDLPHETKRAISTLMAQLKNAHPHNSLHWTEPQNLHITLQFLGEVKLNDLAPLMNHAAQEIQLFPSFELTIGALELFPADNRPRVISLAITPNEVPAALAKTISHSIIATGYEIETRPFRAHLTLAHLNRMEKGFILPNIPAPTLGTIPVTEIVLYQSDPSNNGPRYSILKKFTLQSKGNHEK